MSWRKELVRIGSKDPFERLAGTWSKPQTLNRQPENGTLESANACSSSRTCIMFGGHGLRIWDVIHMSQPQVVFGMHVESLRLR